MNIRCIMLNLLKSYIKLYLNESKLTPGSSSDPGSMSQNTNVYKGKNEQTPGMAGGHGHIEIFKTKIYSPDDGYHYQAVIIDGPSSDPDNGETIMFCSVNDKFKEMFPKDKQSIKISSFAGPDGEMEVLLKAQNYAAKVIRTINAKLGNSKKNQFNQQNIYTFNSRKREPSSF